jgi:hypothetical protein
MALFTGINRETTRLTTGWARDVGKLQGQRGKTAREVIAHGGQYSSQPKMLEVGISIPAHKGTWALS